MNWSIMYHEIVTNKNRSIISWQSDIIKQTKDFVHTTLSGDATGHDWWHIHRVTTLALHIADKENIDPFIVELAALLHDIADWKFNNGDEAIGPRIARNWLESIQVDQASIEHICDIIETISYKGAGVATPMKTKEGMIVQDADRLDALGAIGIARCFAYGGYKGNSLYDPAISITKHESFESYKKSKGTSVNHFYEKLLLLKDRMNTTTGKKLAEKRHQFMDLFLGQFFSEWNCEI